MGGSTRSAKGSTSTLGDDDAMEKLISKLCTKFLTQLEDRLDARFSKFEDKLSEVCESIKTLRDEVGSTAAKVTDIQKKVDTLEQIQKRNSIRISGLPVSDDGDILVYVVDFIKSKLKVDCSSTDIDYCFRTIKDSKCTIIVNFCSNWKKHAVLAAKHRLKGTQIAIFEDLTPTKYKLLSQAKKKFGNNKAWSSGGRIFYWDPKTNKKLIFAE